MNLTKKIFSMFFIVPFFFSCHNSAFNEELFRNPNDPFDDVPKADSLAAEHTVFLSWEEDDASDMFYLMRSPDKVPLSGQVARAEIFFRNTIRIRLVI